MSDELVALQEAINACITARRANRPRVEALLEAWRSVTRSREELVTSMRSALVVLDRIGASDADLEAESATLAALLRGTHSPVQQLVDTERDVRSLDERLASLYGRLHRDTVNVGALGHTQSGKSSFLRAATTLPDTVIPSNAFRSTTAAPSEIFHDEDGESIRLHFHSWETYVSEYLAPLYRGAALALPPGGITQYVLANSYYSEQDPDKKPTERSYLQKLRVAQESLPAYANMLGQRPREIGRTEIRPYVAQPENDSDMERPYHAVRRVSIRTNFGEAGIDGLGLIDLPGFGESGIDVEEQIRRIRYDIDVLLTIRRPNVQSMQTRPVDEEAVRIAKRAADMIPLNDFVFWVINRDREHYPHDEGFAQLARDMQGFLRTDGLSPHIVEANDRSQVVGAMQLLIRRLASRLESMDEALMGAVHGDLRATLDQIMTAAGEFNELKSLGDAAESVDLSKLMREGRRIRGRVARGLARVTDMYLGAVSERSEEARLHHEIGAVAEELRKWCREGFGAGTPEDWRRLHADDISAHPDRTREEVYSDARRRLEAGFSRVDLSLAQAVDVLCDRAAEVLRSELGPAVVPPGRNALEKMRDVAVRHRCHSIVEGLDSLLHVRQNHGGLYIRVGRPIVRSVQTGTSYTGTHAREQLIRAAKSSNDYVDILVKSGQVLSIVGSAMTGLPVGSFGQLTELLGLVNELSQKVRDVAPALREVAQHVPTEQVITTGEPPEEGTAKAAVTNWYEDDSAAGEAVSLETEIQGKVLGAITQLEDALKVEAGVISVMLATAAEQLQDGLGRATNIEGEYTQLYKITKAAAPSSSEEQLRRELTEAYDSLSAAGAQTAQSVEYCKRLSGGGLAFGSGPPPADSVPPPRPPRPRPRPDQQPHRRHRSGERSTSPLPRRGTP